MGKRFAISIGAAALGAAVIAVGASANFRSVNDPRGDTRKCHHVTGSGIGPARPCTASMRRDADIVRATAGHEGGQLRHTIRVVGKSQGAHLEINTDSDPGCEREVLYITRGRGRPGVVRECFGPRTGRARMDFHRHSVEISFSEGSIGNPRSYGWRASTFVGPWEGHVHDYVPNVDTRYIRHRLAQPAAKAPDVVKYDTEVTIAKDRGGFFHGYVKSEVRKCELGRRVVLFKQRPGADRKLGTSQSGFDGPEPPRAAVWGVVVPHGRLLHPGRADVYAKAKPKVRDRFVCRADRSPID